MVEVIYLRLLPICISTMYKGSFKYIVMFLFHISQLVDFRFLYCLNVFAGLCHAKSIVIVSEGDKARKAIYRVSLLILDMIFGLNDKNSFYMLENVEFFKIFVLCYMKISRLAKSEL